jgi:hypothetical protein
MAFHSSSLHVFIRINRLGAHHSLHVKLTSQLTNIPSSQAPSTKVWSITILLQPRTHYVSSIVDSVWRIAKTVPTVLDDEGSSSNYTSVRIHPTFVSHPPPVKYLHQLMPGQSFSSTANSTGENESPRPSLQFWLHDDGDDCR